MLKTTQPKIPSNIFFFLAINFIFTDDQLETQTLLLQPLIHPNNDTLTLTKFGRHQNSLISTTLQNLQKLILLLSRPIQLLPHTNSAATHPTIPVYSVASTCLPRFTTLHPTFQSLIFLNLDLCNFRYFYPIWPQFRCCPASNPPRPTPPPAQRPPTLNSSSPQHISTNQSPQEIPRPLQVPIFNNFCLKMSSFLQPALLLLPSHLRLPRRHPLL